MSEGVARLIVEADGGSRGNPGVAGYGALVRDATGKVLAERAEPLGRASNNVAEYSGLIAGLLVAQDIDPAADVEVRMDSKLVVEQMAGRWKIKHEDMRRLAQEARDLVAHRQAAGGRVSFTWIPREKNGAADKLSNVAMDGLSVDRRIAEPAADEADPRLTDHGTEPRLGVDGAEPPAQPDDAPRGRRRATQPTPDLTSPARIVLVRHGATEATHAGLLDGRGGSDGALSAEGSRQAAAAAAAIRRMSTPAGVRVVTSTLARARQTGAVIAGVLGTLPEADAAWDEQHFGDWEGLTVAQACERDPAAYARLRSDATYARTGGESRHELHARVLDAYQALVEHAQEDGRLVVVVSHRAAILAVLEAELGLGSPWSLTISPASLTSLRRWADGGCAVDVVNDTAHLRG